MVTWEALEKVYLVTRRWTRWCNTTLCTNCMWLVHINYNRKWIGWQRGKLPGLHANHISHLPIFLWYYLKDVVFAERSTFASCIIYINIEIVKGKFSRFSNYPLSIFMCIFSVYRKKLLSPNSILLLFQIWKTYRN